VRGRDFAAGSRTVKVEDIEDTGAEFDQERGFPILKLNRPRILQGFFARDGHIDDSTDTHIEDVQYNISQKTRSWLSYILVWLLSL
jgi:hypothetical protein